FFGSVRTYFSFSFVFWSWGYTKAPARESGGSVTFVLPGRRTMACVRRGGEYPGRSRGKTAMEGGANGLAGMFPLPCVSGIILHPDRSLFPCLQGVRISSS